MPKAASGVTLAAFRKSAPLRGDEVRGPLGGALLLVEARIERRHGGGHAAELGNVPDRAAAEGLVVAEGAPRVRGAQGGRTEVGPQAFVRATDHDRARERLGCRHWGTKDGEHGGTSWGVGVRRSRCERHSSYSSRSSAPQVFKSKISIGGAPRAPSLKRGSFETAGEELERASRFSMARDEMSSAALRARERRHIACTSSRDARRRGDARGGVS